MNLPELRLQKKLFIPAAGTGSRLGHHTSKINKSLISVGNFPVISRIINGYKNITNVVVALGYKGEYVREYLLLAHPDKNFEFINVDIYEGVGSGLGYTMLCCKDRLQVPFIFHACDALVDEYFDELNFDWMGYTEKSDHIAQYRSISFDREFKIISINEKSRMSEESKIYIGIAGISQHKDFWIRLENNPDFVNLGEVAGFDVEKQVRAHKFDWFDIGTIDALEKTKHHFDADNDCTILDKSDEAIWFLASKVYKFSIDKKFIANRIKRSDYLRGFVPDLIDRSEHIYSYSFVNGHVLSRVVSSNILKHLFKFMESFWEKKSLSINDHENFKKTCFSFYKDKTYERIEKFISSVDSDENYYVINNDKIGSIYDLLDKVDWENLSCGLASRFHGDLHFENIIYDEKSNNFKLLDWRQDFGGLTEYGDMYYDLAKIYHGILVSHPIVEQDRYKIEINNHGGVYFSIDRQPWYEEVIGSFSKYVEKNYNLNKVKILTALIFLNIAPLHHYSYNKFLYSIGKFLLHQTIKSHQNGASSLNNELTF